MWLSYDHYVTVHYSFLGCLMRLALWSSITKPGLNSGDGWKPFLEFCHAFIKLMSCAWTVTWLQQVSKYWSGKFSFRIHRAETLNSFISLFVSLLNVFLCLCEGFISVSCLFISTSWLRKILIILLTSFVNDQSLEIPKWNH